VLGANPRTGGRAWRARIGLVLQTTSLDAQLTVSEALMMFGALYPKPCRIAEVLDLIELASDARTRIGALSGGQRRRVDLGLAIIGQPEMLFLDEPTTGARTARGGKHHAPFGQIKRETGAGRFALAADRPAACLQGIEQHARLGGAHGKLRDADRKAG
jgi:ABC-type Na+ transport system ATPase subunit NatA